MIIESSSRNNYWTWNIKLPMENARFFKVYPSNWEVLSLECIHGNCNHLKWIVLSVRIKRIPAIKSPHVSNPDRMVALIRWDIIILTANLFPLQSFGGSWFLNNNIGTITLRSDLGGGIQDSFNEFRNSTG